MQITHTVPRFEVVLKAATATRDLSSAFERMQVLGQQFEWLPVLTLAEALVVCDLMSLAMYRNIERDGFRFEF